MIDEEEETFVADPIGQRLKVAREAKGMTLDDIAAKTRVPIRHLQHMERGEWDALPATTYSVGFARAYATAVGLNPAEIGSELRAQLGAQSMSAPSSYEPADPARVPPRSLAIIAAVIAVLLVAGYFVWRSRAIGDVDTAQVAAGETQPAPVAASPPARAAAAQPAAAPQGPATGPVVLTAVSDVWLRIYEKGGHKLFENTLKAGQSYQIPADAKAPEILTGRPDVIKVSVGSFQIPALGVPDRTIADVSLLPADLVARARTLPPAPSPAAPAAVPPAPPAGAAPTH